jgi:L-glutamine-phosphate cytidylyltransferase
MENNKPKVILLVAGEGKRLRPYTLDRPKCMVEINGMSLIDMQLTVLKSQQLNNIIFIGGYKAEMLKKEKVRLKLNPQYYKTNMVWTLFSAEEELDRDVIISYGDIIYSKEVLQTLLKSTSNISVIIDKSWESYWLERNENPLDDAETLKLRKDGTISEIGKKPKSIDEIEGQYIGLMKFSAKGVMQMKEVFHNAIKDGELLGKSVESSYMTDLLQAMIDNGNKVTAIPINGNWIEIDEVSDLHLEVTHKRITTIQNTF